MEGQLWRLLALKEEKELDISWEGPCSMRHARGAFRILLTR